MRFFKKKKGDVEEPEESGEEIEAPVREKDSKSGYGFSADFEKLKAKVDALSELRKNDSERFAGISEQIGEIRNLILDKEKAIEDVNAKATKAADLVAELQPESIIAELKKASIKYESFDAKIEAVNSLYRKVLEEVKDIRNRLTFLKGTEGLISLNKETAENLARIRKSEANIDRYENKIGNTFIQFQKQFAEFSRFKDWAEKAGEEFGKMKDEFNNVKIKADSTLIGRNDLDAVRLELKQSVSELQARLSRGREGITSERMQNAERRLELFESSLRKTDQLVLGLKASFQGYLPREEFQSKLTEIEGKIARPPEEKGGTAEGVDNGLNRGALEANALEGEYYQLAKDVSKIAREGAIREAIIKYNILKDIYNKLIKKACTPEKSREVYSVLKEAFETVNKAKNKTG